MTDSNPAMPSEDEDFDAVHTGEPVLTDNFDDNNAGSEQSSGTSVKIITDEDDKEPSAEAASETPEPASEPQSEPSTGSESSADEPATPAENSSEMAGMSSEAADTEPASESEPAASESPEPPEPTNSEPETPASTVSEAEVEPSPAAVEPISAVTSTPPKAVKTAQGGMGRMVVELVLVVAVVGLGLWAWQLNSDKQNLTKQLAQANSNPQNIIQKQTDELISKVSKLIQLPSGETPTVANVTDAAQAKQQSAFFTNAANGDKVLMYVKAGEAILYRPSTNKIVLVAPLTFTNNTTTSSTTSKTTTH